mmetsp:Transcript_60144/g.140123  ORF Transcript_60144/g.140123 Transcript_60144/m.140123 type:complete len:253 (+) Transcript_60144:60-818(+)
MGERSGRWARPTGHGSRFGRATQVPPRSGLPSDGPSAERSCSGEWPPGTSPWVFALNGAEHSEEMAQVAFMVVPYLCVQAETQRDQWSPLHSTAPPLHLASLLGPPSLPVREPRLDSASTGGADANSLTVKNTFIDVVVAKPLLERFTKERRVQSCPPEPDRAGSPSASTQMPDQAPLPDGEWPSIGSARHQGRRCKPCAFVGTEKGCANGFECMFCHLCEPGEKKRRQKERWEKHRSRLRRRQERLQQQQS